MSGEEHHFDPTQHHAIAISNSKLITKAHLSHPEYKFPPTLYSEYCRFGCAQQYMSQEVIVIAAFPGNLINPVFCVPKHHDCAIKRRRVHRPSQLPQNTWLPKLS
jgi:hypothetical protein